MLKTTLMDMNVRLNAEVKQALENNRPVVALESSIIANGMPNPINCETAFACEEIIRDHGATPATIAVLDGAICIGLTKDQILSLGSTRADAPVRKLGSRDLPSALVKKDRGATTVSATMACAELVGIKVFATGGIGGVHRGGELSLDISTDLEMLARKNVAVVCAGVKSILDIGRTLEVLETLSVPVIGFQSKAFPSFFCRTSGYDVGVVADTAEEIATIVTTKWGLNLSGGVLIANPIPTSHALEENTVEAVIKEALDECVQKGIRGQEVTPFLLDILAKKTNGQTLEANVALVKNNAALAAQIAGFMIS